MDKVYKPNQVEEKWYKIWESNGYFTPKIDKSKKPFSILLPLPNANDPMHMGHALFVIQDIMIRYHRMLGDPTLWLPGADHAGIETQFVFEKHLKKDGKSRFDYDRNTLYNMIWDFVEKNREINQHQMKRLGFSLDWTRYHYSLEPEIVENVFSTFRKLHHDGLIYRGERIINYCTRCGTAFSELEINYVERKDPLYFIKYGPFILATTRPETKFGDTAVAFHPGDKRYMKYLGREIEIFGVNGTFRVKVIADQDIDPEFGTGIEKVTPGHDQMDFEIGLRHNLPIKKVIDRNGRLNCLAGRFAGMKVLEARIAVFEEMQKMGLIDHVDENYVHNVATCYRCKTIIEPMIIPQWFIKMEPLAKPAIDAVKKRKTRIVPKKRFEKMYFDWLKNIHDWNISRQIVWGPRIPVWYCLDCNPNIEVSFIKKTLSPVILGSEATPESKRTDSEQARMTSNENVEKISGTYKVLKDKYAFEEIKSGLQSLVAPQDSSYQLTYDKCEKCHSSYLLQETDTFDTWFLSGQWPLNTLGTNIDNPKESSADFKYFYPTSVLDTLWDILFFWVARMMMLGIYVTGKVPFDVIHLHARVVDKFGQKMSKSRGNVIDPLKTADIHGADALRMALVMGVAPASDINLSEEKIIGMRNFTNKLWNIGRFLKLNLDLYKEKGVELEINNHKIPDIKKPENKKILKAFHKLINHVTRKIETYHFGQTAEILYAFIWHEFADIYVENSKDKLREYDKEVLTSLIYVYSNCLTLLHPFMPFITEEIYSILNPNNNLPLIISPWPVK